MRREALLIAQDRYQNQAGPGMGPNYRGGPGAVDTILGEYRTETPDQAIDVFRAGGSFNGYFLDV